MAGGILQLVAKGIQDVFLTSEPEITFFKMVYRRHTNFSKTELDLSFATKLDFGTVGSLKIQKYGDLLHRLFLVIKLPKIELVIKNLTVLQAEQLLAAVGITWQPVPNRSVTTVFTQTDYDQVDVIVTAEIDKLQSQIDNEINPDLLLLGSTGSLYPPTWMHNTGHDDSAVPAYMSDALLAFFANDEYNIQYQFTQALIADAESVPLTNSDALLEYLFEKFAAYATSSYVGNFNDDNLLFMFNVDNTTYNIDPSVENLTSDTLFLNGISNAYSSASDYTSLDAYKIFNADVTNNAVVVTPSYNITLVKQSLITDIRYDLQKNILQLNNIYNSFEYTNDPTNMKLMFYRVFPVTAGSYDTSKSWINLSLQTVNDASLQDNFTTDFAVGTVSPDEPANIYHPMGIYVTNSVNTFHLDNRSAFRTSVLNNYFNQTSLWSRLDIKASGLCVETITGSPTGTVDPIFYNTYFLNFIPFLTNTDIPLALIKSLSIQQAANIGNPTIYGYLLAISQTIYVPSSNTGLAVNVMADVNTTITPLTCVSDDFTSIKTMNQSFKTTQGQNGDILDVSIIRQNEFVGGGGNTYFLIPDYVPEQYMIMLDDPAFQSQSFSAYYNSTVKAILQQVINLFRTPLASIPSFSTYQAQNYNLTNVANLQINDKINNVVYSDAISSIWYYLNTTVVDDYNSLYNNNILNLDATTGYPALFGSEISVYLNEISRNYFGYTPANPFVDYYYESTLASLNLQQYYLPYKNDGSGTLYNGLPNIGYYLLNEKLAILQLQLQHFDKNYGLLFVKSILVNKPTQYFEAFMPLVDYIMLDTIEAQEPTYYHENHDGAHDSDGDGNIPGGISPSPYPPGEDYVLIVYAGLTDPSSPYYDINDAHATPTDVFNIVNGWYAQLITSTTNPFDISTDPAKHDLYNKIQPLTPDEQVVQLDNYNTLFGFINPTSLYNMLVNINRLYDGFALPVDIYNFMNDLVINNSFLKDVPSLADQFSVTTTNANMVTYFENYLENNQEQIVSLTTVLATLELSLQGGAPANFAWIKWIGHYIINSIKVYIGDQLIDTHTGEWLQFWHSLTRRMQKERGYNIMIGNSDDLTTFNTDIKNAYELVIPLKFWFCNNVGASLPLVALKNTDITLKVDLKTFDQVSYYDSFTKFVGTPKLDCKMIGEFIFLENDERAKLVKAKNEYLIEVLQMNGNKEVKAENLTNIYNDDLSLSDDSFETKLYFHNPVKEIIWALQDTSKTDGSLPNGELQYYNYMWTTFNPSQQVKIQFMGRDREQYKDIDFYNILVPYKYHNATPFTGLNVYSLSLDPENVMQPKGAANMGRIDDSAIITILRPDVIAAMQLGTKFQLVVYAVTYQVLRAMSGFAGVAFYY
jgi:hypothetical protein